MLKCKGLIVGLLQKPSSEVFKDYVSPYEAFLMYILKSGLKWLKLYSSTPDMFSLIKKSAFLRLRQVRSVRKGDLYQTV